MAEMLIDGEFLGNLMQNSMESHVGSAMEAVAGQSDLFGGADDVDVRVIATYKDHVIVANSDGEFFRAGIKEGKLDKVEQLEVPVVSEEEIGRHVREQANRAVQAIVSGDIELAQEELRSLSALADQGTRLTAESVEEDAASRWYSESDWFLAMKEDASVVEGFLGDSLPKLQENTTKFEGIIDESADADKFRSSVKSALKTLRDQMVEMNDKLSVAKQVKADYKCVNEDDTAAADYEEFVSGVSEDIDAVISLLSDAVTVSEDGDVKSLAKTHDVLASDLNEWMVATAFAEKLADRFSVPPSDEDGGN